MQVIVVCWLLLVQNDEWNVKIVMAKLQLIEFWDRFCKNGKDEVLENSFDRNCKKCQPESQ